MAWRDDFVKFCDRRGTRWYELNGVLWYVSREGILQAMEPAERDISVSATEVEYLRRKARAKMWRFSSGFVPYPTEWWHVICTKFLPPEVLTAKLRSQVLRGLRNCSAYRVDADFLMARGYTVHLNALKRYDTAGNGGSEEQFREFVGASRGLDDTFHWWGVFVGNMLAGYAQVTVMGDVEAAYAKMRLDPQFFGYYTSYALVHRMNEYYLGDERVRYANDGTRSIRHDTNFQEFLQKKFGFNRAYSRLHVGYCPAIAGVTALAYPFRRLVPSGCRAFEPIHVLLRQETIARSCRCV